MPTLLGLEEYKHYSLLQFHPVLSFSENEFYCVSCIIISKVSQYMYMPLSLGSLLVVIFIIDILLNGCPYRNTNRWRTNLKITSKDNPAE